MSKPIKEGLIRPAMAALKWNYLGAGTRAASGLIVGVVLARLLGPKPFGQVAVASLIIGLGNLMADCGFGAALVQSRDLSSDDIRFTFTAQLGLGVLLSAIVAAAAPFIAMVFRLSDVVPVIRALSVVFALQAFGLTAFNLLKRDLAFRKIQIAQVTSYLVGYLGLGIPLAYLGFGVWSLVAAQLAQTLLYSSLLYASVRHSICPRITRNHHELASFGGKVIGVNLANWAITNSDTAIVGRAFGAVSLGLYNRSMTLMTTPMNAVVATLQAVLFPVYSRAQGRPEALRRGFLTSASVVEICILPVFLAIAAVPQTVIGGLYGQRWIEAVPLITPLALAMPLHALMALSGPLLWGVGKVERELHVQMAMAAIAVPTLIVASRYSLLAVAWSVFCLYALRSLFMTRAVLRVISAKWEDLFRALFGAALLGAVIAPSLWIQDRLLLPHLAAPVRLGADMLLAFVVSLGLVACASRLVLSEEVIAFLSKSFDGLPRQLRRNERIEIATIPMVIEPETIGVSDSAN